MFRFFGYRSFEPEYQTMAKMPGLGIDTITFMVSNNTNFMGEPYTRYQPTWIWMREYDFTLFDQNIADIRKVAPEAKLICCIDLNPPNWWYRRGPVPDAFLEFGRLAASQQYREDVVDYLQALLRHATEKYPGEIKAFALMGGKTTEWFDGSAGCDSAYRNAYWKEYCRKNGLPECDPPGMEERYKGCAESGGLIRVPAENQRAIDFWKCNSDQTADTMELFIAKAREILPPEIGLTLCYGYMFELAGKRSMASWGHLYYERIFSNPGINFALEPISYGVDQRGMGGSPVSMIPMQTLKCRGKNILNSVDITTFTSRLPPAPGKSGAFAICGRGIEWHTPEEVRAGIRREMCFNLINGCSTWYFDMWGGWWDSDAAQETLKECRAIWDRETPAQAPDAFEVLLTVDPENLFLLNDAHDDVKNMVIPIRDALAKTGVSYTTASFNDLELMDLDKYKVIILAHPFDLDNGKLEKIRTVLEGKTVVWLYGPGIVHNGKWDPENMESICGRKFGENDYSIKTVSGIRSAYIGDQKNIDIAALKSLLCAAGVHCWSEDDLRVYANSALVAAHAGKAGKYTITLPESVPADVKVTELFSGKEYSGRKITIEVDAPATMLFKYA